MSRRREQTTEEMMKEEVREQKARQFQDECSHYFNGFNCLHCNYPLGMFVNDQAARISNLEARLDKL